MTEGERYSNMMLRHRKLVWWLCFRYAWRDAERCADLVQDVCANLWLHYGELREDCTAGEERKWVELHARDVLRIQYRRQQRQPQLVSLPGELADLRAEDDDDTRQRARDLVDTLPDDDRRLMLMRFDGYSAEEIGQALGISANSVYQRIHRITQRLKRKANPDNHAKKQ